MKRIKFILAAIVIVALAGCLMFACSSDGGAGGADGDSSINGWNGGKNTGGGGGGPSAPGSNVERTSVTDTAITGLVQPRAGYPMVTTLNPISAQYTGTVTWWEDNGDNTVSATSRTTFDEFTGYVAQIALTAVSSYTFAGIPADGFTVTVDYINPSAGTIRSWNNVAGSGTTIDIWVFFSTTGSFPAKGIDIGQDITYDNDGIGTFVIVTFDGAGSTINGITSDKFTYSGGTIQPVAALTGTISSSESTGLYTFTVPAVITTGGELTITYTEAPGTYYTAVTTLLASNGGTLDLDVAASNGTITPAFSGTAVASATGVTPETSTGYVWFTGGLSGTLISTAGTLVYGDYPLGQAITCVIKGASDYAIGDNILVSSAITVFKVKPEDTAGSSNATGTGTSSIASPFGTSGSDITIALDLNSFAIDGTASTKGGVFSSAQTSSITYTIASGDAETNGEIIVTVTWNDQ